MSQILIILDLDETLIHATSKPHDENWDFEVFGYKVYKRPFLEEFLRELIKNFKVAVWSSASDDYVNEVVKYIFFENYPLEFIWGRSRCTYKLDYEKLEKEGYHDPYSHYEYIKRLSKLRKKGFKKDLILIIDDTPRKCMHNYGNAIYPTEFLGDKLDNELNLLSKYLIKFKDVSTVRNIEKRYWKTENHF